MANEKSQKPEQTKPALSKADKLATLALAIIVLSVLAAGIFQQLGFNDSASLAKNQAQADYPGKVGYPNLVESISGSYSPHRMFGQGNFVDADFNLSEKNGVAPPAIDKAFYAKNASAQCFLFATDADSILLNTIVSDLKHGKTIHCSWLIKAAHSGPHVFALKGVFAKPGGTKNQKEISAADASPLVGQQYFYYAGVPPQQLPAVWRYDFSVNDPPFSIETVGSFFAILSALASLYFRFARPAATDSGDS